MFMANTGLSACAFSARVGCAPESRRARPLALLTTVVPPVLAPVLLAVLLAVSLLLTAAPPVAWASTFEGASSDLSITVTCVWSGLSQPDAPQPDEPRPGVTFELYRVADVSLAAGAGELSMTLAGDFAAYQVELADLDASGWRAAAATLVAYAERDGLAPLTSGTTNEAGTLTFSAGNVSAESADTPTSASAAGSVTVALEPGLYLLRGEPFTDADGMRWSIEPALVSLPAADGQGGWTGTAQVVPKMSSEMTTAVQVYKVWAAGSDAPGAGSDVLGASVDDPGHPGEVTVQLLGNGAVIDEVELSAVNNWRYTWDNLDPALDYAVAEKDVPAGYTVAVSREDAAFVVVNTYVGTPGEPGEPDVPATPGEPAGPDAPDTPATPDNPVDSGQKLPQTGQLWWPVLVLLAVGLVCLVIGLVRRRLSSDRG